VRRNAGLTLVELVVAAGLLSILMLGVFQLLDDFLSMWEKSEHRRVLVEETSGVLELMAEDLWALEPGPRGDVLAEWVLWDVDGDGVKQEAWPRLRVVRHASPAELQRLRSGDRAAVASANAPTADADDPQAGPPQVTDEGLIEVCWVVLPAHPGTQDVDLRAEGYLWRGERIFGGEPKQSFFAKEFLSAGGKPRPGAVNEVSGGILWLGLQFATQTSLIHDDWKIGNQLADTAASWDAWARERPDLDAHYYNEAGAGMPPARGRPLLPRRVRIEIEIERQKDLKRRTRLARFAESKENRLVVLDGQRSPAPGGYVRVDQEWMQVRSVVGDSITVQRAQRGTKAAIHDAGALVHWGQPAVREIPVPTFQEDWNL
jgi:hypothetical protein